jgi:hypothetical protein
MGSMQKLISLLPPVAGAFGELTGKTGPEWFCTHDPVGQRLGSGGGTIHLLREAWRDAGAGTPFADWVARNKGIMLHAGGQSRRLPAYAAEGKALIPVPVFRWATGQRIDQTLVDLQTPFLERVMEAAPGDSRWMVASGDVLVHAEALPGRLPQADVLCLGIWGEPEQATRHGVFFVPKNDPEGLAFMLQKPTLEEIREHAGAYYFMLDVGIWLLSARAMRVLLERAIPGPGDAGDGVIGAYDLYGEFGPALGRQPHRRDDAVNRLTAAVLPLEGGEFYHFGSAPDLIESVLRLQNRISDQRRLTSTGIKPHPSLFVQNSHTGDGLLGPGHERIWIENSHVPAGWELQREHVITGIPENDWRLRLPAGACLDIVPLRGGGAAARVYGFRDPFRGCIGEATTLYCGQAAGEWLAVRGLSPAALGIDPSADIQEAPLFPVFTGPCDPAMLQWLLSAEGDFADAFRAMPRVSAEDITRDADLAVIRAARERRIVEALPVLARNAGRSVF